MTDLKKQLLDDNTFDWYDEKEDFVEQLKTS